MPNSFETYLLRAQRWIKNNEATALIILVCTIVFVVQQFASTRFLAAGIFAPTIATPPFGFQIWRYLTSLFMHASWTHLFFNMLALWSCGPIFERFLGKLKFIIIYLGSGIGGNLLYAIVFIFFNTFPFIGTNSTYGFAYGASGAIFGLFGGLIIIHKRLGASANQLLLIVGINLLIGWTFAGIAWQAHVGGLIAGILLTRYFIDGRMRKPNNW